MHAPLHTNYTPNRAISQNLIAPMQCFCNAAVPCGTCCNEEDSQCYYSWWWCYGAAGSGLMVSDGGTKFKQEWMCCNCGEYELDEAPGGTPQGVEMQRS